MKAQTNHLRILALLFFLVSSFLYAGDDDTAIKIKDRKITAREFLNRLNSLPRGVKGTPEEIKENLICTLIAEAVLASEASKAKLDTVERSRLMSEELKKEALYEIWMEEEIRNKVRYSEKELQDTYAKMREVRTVEFWTFSTEKEALEFKSLASKDTLYAARPQTKDLKCGEALEEVENAVYSLQQGEMTSPLMVDNAYYIFKLKSVAPHPEYSQRNYIYWIRETEELVKSRKESRLLDEALFAVMQDKDFTIDSEAYDHIYSKLYPIIYGSDGQLRFPKSEYIQLDLINNENNTELNIDNRVAVRFKNGAEWKTGDLWKKISVSPYPLNYKDPNDLKQGLFHVIRRIILLESIAEDAAEKGRDTSWYVRSESAMWDRNLSAWEFIKNYSNSLAITDGEVQALYDSIKYNYVKPEIRKIEYISVQDKELANSIYMQAASGADFEDLFRKYNDSSKLTEDEIASFITENMWGEIGKTAFKLKPGAISLPVQTSDTSYAVIKLLETRESAPYPLDEVRDQLKMQKRLYEVVTYLNNYMAEVIKDYDVTINRPLIDKTFFLEGDMAVKKSHFPLRNSVPSAFVFSRNAKWYEDLLSRISASSGKK